MDISYIAKFTDLRMYFCDYLVLSLLLEARSSDYYSDHNITVIDDDDGDDDYSDDYDDRHRDNIVQGKENKQLSETASYHFLHCLINY